MNLGDNSLAFRFHYEFRIRILLHCFPLAECISSIQHNINLFLSAIPIVSEIIIFHYLKIFRYYILRCLIFPSLTGVRQDYKDVRKLVSLYKFKIFWYFTTR